MIARLILWLLRPALRRWEAERREMEAERRWRADSVDLARLDMTRLDTMWDAFTADRAPTSAIGPAP